MYANLEIDPETPVSNQVNDFYFQKFKHFLTKSLQIEPEPTAAEWDDEVDEGEEEEVDMDAEDEEVDAEEEGHDEL